ncbi:hypothetical protein SPKIRA_07010 [Sphingomonas paucimobilis]|uniref:Uncharacterized protein n=1 Tax=Sphingomonas paucimobilis TaxID=13689 RepID=A0A7T3E531_SPHPI|nr:hypothetical protein [Sphingomonas paucimobilis]QPT07889.1 hypothetical protein I6G38_14005 [Sphingomonas paucimobilis]BCI69871.1 hypothetical protein SPKIRA_07010 [Sphingomonas paucimobilis]
MRSVELIEDRWTLIVPAGEKLDAVIRPVSGAFRTSLLYPEQQWDTVLKAPPTTMQGNQYSRHEVTAGMPVYAQAVGGPATASVEMVEMVER